MTSWLCVLAWVAAGVTSDFVQRLEPVDFVGTDYYLTGGNSGTPPALLEDLQRGHEGLIVKLNEITKALKEDELKLNNVFYKLGRHETNLEGVTTTMHRLSTDSRRIEAKLNKHAFNVDFLRRKVEVLQRNVEGKEQVGVQVAAVRAIVDRLDDRLTGALARLGLVENTTKTLEKRSAPYHENLPSSYLMTADRPPTLTVYPEPRLGTCKPDWKRVGHGCYWFGGEELTFPEAVAACVRLGGHLLTLGSPGTQLSLLLAHLQPHSMYWTSGTDAFNRGNWVFMMTAQPVMPLHWSASDNSTSNSKSNNHRCAGLSPHGLIKHRCTHRLPYICHTL